MFFYPVFAYLCYVTNAPWWCWGCLAITLVLKFIAMLIKVFNAGAESK